MRVLGVSGLRVRQGRNNNKEGKQPEKRRPPRAAAENSGKATRTIGHGTAPSVCIVAEEEKEKQLIRARSGSSVWSFFQSTRRHPRVDLLLHLT
jgi:hypothetical protein